MISMLKLAFIAISCAQSEMVGEKSYIGQFCRVLGNTEVGAKCGFEI